MIKWKLTNRNNRAIRIAFVGDWPVGSVYYDNLVSKNTPNHWKTFIGLPMIDMSNEHYSKEKMAMNLVESTVTFWFRRAGYPLGIIRRNRIIGIVVSESRNDDYNFRIVENEFLRHYREGDTICSGLAPHGADRFAATIAKKYETSYVWHKPNYKRYGNPDAELIRNRSVAKNSDILIACIAKGKGNAKDMLRKFKNLGKKNWYLV